MRVVLADEKQSWTFAVSPSQLHHAVRSPSTDESEPAWRAVAGPAAQAWFVEMAIPRHLFPAKAKLKVNVLHRRAAARGYEELSLCPAYVLGPNPDMLPDWKPGDAVESFAELRFQ